jgi:threonine/homoserine/homoserine lactone efflux protein
MQLLAICLLPLVFGFVGSMPLAGPIAVMAMSRATSGKYREALRIALGACVAEGLYAGIAFWGFTTFLARHAIVVPISHGATAVILVAVGARFVFWKPEGHEKDGEKDKNKVGTALLGFSISALNPTLLLTWSAAVAFLYSRGLREPPPLYAVPFGLCAGAGVGGWFVVLVGLMERFGEKVPQAALTWLVRSMGFVLVVLGVWSGVKLVRFLEGTNAYADRVDTRRASVSLVVDRAHYERVTLALANARTSVWIATANVKQLMIEAPIGTRARARGLYVPILDTLQSLCDRNVSVRLLHASPPSRPFREELAARAARLPRPQFEMRACPRVHMKMIAIDGALLYLGSANFTGAGLGAKGDGRRNFEMGILTDDEWMLDEAQARFDRIWRGTECAGCGLRRECPAPLDGVQQGRPAGRAKKRALPGTVTAAASPSLRASRRR